VKNHIRIFILLFGFWIILSESATVESLVLGMAVCIAVMIYNRNSIPSKGVCGLKKVMLALRFTSVLLKEIVLSNFQVAAIVLGRKLRIEPQVFEYRTKLKTDKYRSIFANAITLTPGTITLSVEDDKLVIHGLRRENIEGVVNSEIEKILIQIEGV
jgi:multicomponent Na+:H+ antiporter subunit E